MQKKITTFLTFKDQALQAAEHYTSIFKGSRITSKMPGPGGSVMAVTFELEGQEFMALNGGPTFSFSEGISLFVSCETQAEVDELWAKLTDGGAESQCGWLKDRFGVSWQIIPTALTRLMSSPVPGAAGRVVQAMLKMQKIDIAALQAAHDASS
jgi:predicted 3-demethylubiquinone-9 3-methyltransferase (glyoxalase superfamily)